MEVARGFRRVNTFNEGDREKRRF